MEETYPRPLALLVALLAVGLGLALLWGQLRPAVDAPAPWAVQPLPTLQATPAISVPAPAPPAPTVAPVVYIERNEGNVTVNNIDVDVCIGICR